MAILKVCRAAVAPEARLLIIERTVTSDGQTPLSVLYADLEMLVNVGGQERTRDQY